MITAEPEKATLRIFLSFAASDRALAQRLQSLLAEEPSWPVFRPDTFRPDTLSAGEDWLARLKTEIEACDIFIVLLTSASLNSSFVLSDTGRGLGFGEADYSRFLSAGSAGYASPRTARCTGNQHQ